MRITTYKPYGVALGVAVCLLGLCMVWKISALPDAVSYAAVGPKVFPAIVGWGMALVGVTLITEAILSKPSDETPMEYDILPVLIILAGLIFASYALAYLGWILTSTIIFIAGATAFRERRIVATFVIGLALGLSSYLLFNYALKLNLPAGVLGL